MAPPDPPAPAAARPGPANAEGPLSWFAGMVGHNLEHARAAQALGKPVVGILCEFTPRELILAAGGVPALLCGGSGERIPAAEEVLPANLCPLIKSTYGYSLEAANPFLEMADLVVAETTCDGKKKMYELLARRHPMHVLELPQMPGDPGARAHWLGELRKLRSALEERFGVEITDQRLRGAIALMNRERRLRRELAQLMRAAEPPLTGRELLDLRAIVAAVPEDLAQYERALETLPGRRIEPPAAGRTRALLTGVPLPHGAERVLDVIEDSGGLVVCQENCTGIKPLLEDVDEEVADPLEALADKYFHLPCSVMTDNQRRLDSLRALIEEYRVECVIDLVWPACLTYDVESQLVRELVEEQLGLPYLRIETDYSPSDSARIRMRVQALFETVRARA